MATTETRLTRAAIALSVLLVVVLGALATYSVLGGDDTGSDPAADPVPPDEERAYPGPIVEVGDRERPFQVGCVPAPSPDGAYTLAITNLADATADYLVSVALLDDDGRPSVTTVEVLDLAPSEEREIGVADSDVEGRIVDCEIASVQGDRRLLLANS